MSGNKFIGGKSTDPELDFLERAFPASKMNAGDKYTFDQLAQAMNCDYGSDRFYRVVRRWSKKLRRVYGVVLKSDYGVGYMVADDAGKLSLVESRLDRAITQARVAQDISSLIDRNQLTDEQKKTHDHTSLRSGLLLSAAKLKSRAQLPTMADGANKAKETTA